MAVAEEEMFNWNLADRDLHITYSKQTQRTLYCIKGMVDIPVSSSSPSGHVGGVFLYSFA